MRLASLASLLNLSCAFLLVACSSVASTAQNQPTPVSDSAEMYAVMAAAGQPSAEHQRLNMLEGTWQAQSMWKMTPDAPAEESIAKSKKSLVLNRLFLQEQYDDQNSRHPFKGIGMLGFDNVMGNYTSTWFDTMPSATWQSSGVIKEAGVIHFRGGGSCPVTGDSKEVTSELELIDANKHILRMYDHTPDGTEFKNLEIVYTRVS